VPIIILNEFGHGIVADDGAEREWATILTPFTRRPGFDLPTTPRT
jgi:hypothetical protein